MLTHTAIDGTTRPNHARIRGGVVIEGTALYYSGSPALGNLALSIAAEPGMDVHGNTYPAGVVYAFHE